MSVRIALGALVVLATVFLPVSAAATRYLVQAEYVDQNDVHSEKIWQVEVASGDVLIRDNNRIHCRLDMRNGAVVGITIMKRHQGKYREFRLSNPMQIEQELRTSFYPYVAALDMHKRSKGHMKDWQVGSTMFKLISEED